MLKHVSDADRWYTQSQQKKRYQLVFGIAPLKRRGGIKMTTQKLTFTRGNFNNILLIQTALLGLIIGLENVLLPQYFYLNRKLIRNPIENKQQIKIHHAKYKKWMEKKYEKVLLALYLQHFELLAMEIEKEKSINKLIGIALSHLFDSIPVASISVASAKGWTRIEKAWFGWKGSMI